MPHFDADVEFVIFGVVTEHCVRYTVDGLLRRGRRVAVVTDAIQSLDQATGREMLADFRARGASLLNTEEALSLLALPLARSA